MNRLFWWLIRAVAIIVFVLGVLFIVFDLVDVEKGLLVPGIVMAVVGLIVGTFAGKKKDNAKAAKVHKALKTCKKCGGEYSSQYKYTYNLGKANKSPYSGLLVVPVNIEFRCTKCGAEKTFFESLEIAGVRPEDEVREVVEDWVHRNVG